MKKDIYIQKELCKYGLRANSIIGKKFNDGYFEYCYHNLDENDLIKIIHFVKKELLLKKNKKRKLSEKDKLKKNLLKDLRKNDLFDSSILKDFQKALSSEKKWSNAFEALYSSHKSVYLKVLKIIQTSFKRQISKESKKSPFEINLESVKKIFRLSQKEGEILTFLHLLEFDSSAEFFSRELNMRQIIKTVKLYCRLLDISPKNLKKLMSKDAPLIRSGLIRKSHNNELEISPLVIKYLADFSQLDLIENFISKSNSQDFLNIDYHTIPKEKTSNIINLMKTSTGSNILLYGSPGTGKTEFVKSLGRLLGRSIYFINQKNEEGEEDIDHRKSAIVAALNMLDKENSIIVVDECDAIININNGFWPCDRKGNDNKAWINDLLENSQHKFIWISNRIQGIDDSTKRRFSYSVEFSNLGHKQRVKVWENQIKINKVDFLDQNKIENLAKTYKVNAGGIALALKDVTSMNFLKDDVEKVSVLTNILSQHQSFIFGNTKLNTISNNYSIDVLNCDMDLKNVIESTKRFINYQPNGVNKEIANMNFLLQGPPGTGKTEFAKYMSEILGREIMIKRISDIRSKWYGENLQNIAAMFKEAQAKECILFLDEADTFFMNRENSHEHYVSETNELLTQMENFQGILVCATNLSSNMDHAVMRRFNYKIKFDYLTEDSKVAIFQKFLGGKTGEILSNTQLDRLKRIPNLTPGDFKVVHQKNYFSDEISSESLLEQLEIESSYKKNIQRPLGIFRSDK